MARGLYKTAKRRPFRWRLRKTDRPRGRSVFCETIRPHGAASGRAHAVRRRMAVPSGQSIGARAGRGASETTKKEDGALAIARLLRAITGIAPAFAEKADGFSRLRRMRRQGLVNFSKTVVNPTENSHDAR